LKVALNVGTCIHKRGKGGRGNTSISQLCGEKKKNRERPSVGFLRRFAAANGNQSSARIRDRMQSQRKKVKKQTRNQSKLEKKRK